MMEIDGERAYPIWKIVARWSELGKQDPKSPWRHRGLPKNHVWNSTVVDKMFRVDGLGWDDLEAEAEKWWSDYLGAVNRRTGKRNFEGDACLRSLKLRYRFHETWCQEWFGHWTFDVGQADVEARESFQRFVRRMENRNRVGLWFRPYQDDDGQTFHSRQEPYCLMGAEERYRWHGNDAATRDDRGESTEPPCRCLYCRQQGVLRISH